MVKITFINGNEERLIETKTGETLLEAAVRNGINLYGGCSGAGVCGTCHVLIDRSFVNKLNEPSNEELDLLEVLQNTGDNSRLACQVIITDDLDGSVVTIP
jgi:2Fe-2S ferredoxin